MSDDTISRQAAIDEVRSYYDEIYGDPLSIEERIAALPSAQPEPCEDTVSRQRLLSDLKELVAAWKKYPVMAEQIKGVEAAIGYVEAIPSAQPELNEWCYDCKEYDKEHHCCPRWNRVIKTTLADVHSEQQWIPCSERLPKPFEYCLWTTTDGRVVYHHCDGLFSNYTAWMPLPEPYKGEQE